MVDNLQEIKSCLQDCLKFIQANTYGYESEYYSDEIKNLIRQCEDDISKSKAEEQQEEDTYSYCAPYSHNSVAGY